MNESKSMITIITGILGQDGSVLAKQLLDQGHEVHGIYRRISTGTVFDNILDIQDHPNLHLIEGDITDAGLIYGLVQQLKPDYFFNLAAMSNVGTSFKEPQTTFRVNAEAVIIQLEALRMFSPKTKYYQASTSESFGGLNCPEPGYSESSLFHPRSPYAVAKVAAYHSVVNYREAYGLHANNGILFNHSCIKKTTPIFLKIGNRITIKQVNELLPFTGCTEQLVDDEIPYEIWNGKAWVKLKTITVRAVEQNNPDHIGQISNTRSGVVETTAHHNMLVAEENEDVRKLPARELKIGDHLLHGEYPNSPFNSEEISLSEAELLGLIAGDGHVSQDSRRCTIANISSTIIERIKWLWKDVTGIEATVGKVYINSLGSSCSVKLTGFNQWDLASFSRDMLYTADSLKRVPDEILNASHEIMTSFLNGYNLADGLKKNPCIYKYKNFKSNSPVLAQGLLFLIANTTKQDYNVTVEQRDENIYYSINLLSDRQTSSEKKETVDTLISEGNTQRGIAKATGISRTFIRKISRNLPICARHYRWKNRTELKKQLETELDYVYDIETETQSLMAGVGTIVIANSPRRGLDFATRRITQGVAKCKLGLQDKIHMGNLSALRDEGHSSDYMVAAKLIMDQSEPGDYVVATGVTVSIEDMFRYVCSLAELEFEDLYVQDARYLRPSDVPYLKGDASKIRVLGWEPTHTWQSLLKEMYENDLKKLA